MSKVFVLFPNQLFYDEAPKAIKDYDNVLIVEEPMFFYDSKYRPMKPNKIKLAYMVACMKAFANYMKDFHKSILYIPYDEVGDVLKKTTTFACFEPYDNELKAKYSKMKIIDTSPYFLMNKDQMTKFNLTKSSKGLSHASYYEFVKKELGVLKNVKSYDEENRRPLNPKVTKIARASRFDVNKYYTEAILYVENHPIFKKHCGITENVLYFPITPNDCAKRLKEFCKGGLKHYGEYQDAFVKENGVDNSILFHSNLSAALNIGILSPSKVLTEALKAKDNAPINSIEGFVRQVIGWREYCGFLYQFYYNDLRNANNFNAKRPIDDGWYRAETGNEVVDREIKKAMSMGYSHHIVRLMVFLNWFVLTEVRSEDIVKWFMEIVSIDAYHWVMWTNIQMMSYYWPKAMRKPYISTSSYIVKMSNYKKDGKWNTAWDALFYAFLYKHKAQLTGSSKIYLRNLAYFERLDTGSQKLLLGIAKQWLA